MAQSLKRNPNYHVAKEFGNFSDPVFRFDFSVTPDGKPFDAGKEYKLSGKNYLISQSGEGGLDYALLELKGSPGKEAPAGAAKLEQRGWIKPIAYDFQKGEPLVIVQHPKGSPQKMAFGAVVDVPAKQARIIHNVSTQEGSSGSPCLNSSLELVALHYWGSDTKNAAIRFSAILEHLGDDRKRIET